MTGTTQRPSRTVRGAAIAMIAALCFAFAFLPRSAVGQTVPTIVPAPTVQPSERLPFVLASAGGDPVFGLWTMIRLAYTDELPERIDGSTLIVLTTETDDETPIDYGLYLAVLDVIARLQPAAIQVDDRLTDARLPAERYVGLMRQAFSVIKRVSPDTLALTGPIDNDAGEAEYRAALAAAGVDEFTDCIGVRFPGAADPRFDSLEFAGVINPYAEAFPDKPLCITAADAPRALDLIRLARVSGRVRLFALETTQEQR